MANGNGVSRSYGDIIGVRIEVEFDVICGPRVAFEAAIIPVGDAGRNCFHFFWCMTMGADELVDSAIL